MWRFTELFGISTLAIAQPVFNVYSENPQELIRLDVTGPAILVWLVIVLMAPPPP